MDKIEQLETRIAELEYRLRVIEKFLDYPGGPLFHKDNKEIMNSIRLQVIQGMKKDGLDTSKFKDIWGPNFSNRL